MGPSSNPPSKLFVRSEVLAVIEFLTVVDSPTRQERNKQVKRLAAIESRGMVLDILLKELSRNNSPKSLEVITELLMDLGNIDDMKDPLWTLIRHNDTPDEVKDAANLVLRHLGDNSDPDLYLDYLDDPQGLISRETERMLEVAAQNPEALIDFIDFIFSLPVPEQLNLMDSLHADYAAEHLVNLYIPIFMADPPDVLKELILHKLVEIRTPAVALFFRDLNERFNDPEAQAQIDPNIAKAIKKAISELRLAGVYKEDRFEEYAGDVSAHPHAITQTTVLSTCYATLIDGIGNQGLMICRTHENGDRLLVSIVINDLNGIVDCFGFAQLSEEDFQRIVDKFHEEACRLEVSEAYCRYRLQTAEALNSQHGYRIPYEYTCWKVAMADLAEASMDLLLLAKQLAKPEWAQLCNRLYQHPELQTWFLEEEDHPVVQEVLQSTHENAIEAIEKQVAFEAFAEMMDRYAYGLTLALMTTHWRQLLVTRLMHLAYLFDREGTQTFAALAATEAMKLINYQPEDEVHVLRVGFIRQFGRRCIEEYLLRIKYGMDVATNHHAELSRLTDALVSYWDVVPLPESAVDGAHG